MEITLEDLERFEQRFEQKFDQKLAENQSNTIKWVIGLFFGTAVVVTGTVAFIATAVMLVTQ